MIKNYKIGLIKMFFFNYYTIYLECRHKSSFIKLIMGQDKAF